jgi:hypothetical protein
MRKKLIQKTRKNFLNLKKNKETCQDFVKVALETKGFKNINQKELSNQLDNLEHSFNRAVKLIKKQENNIDKKGYLFRLPSFMLNNAKIKKEAKNMRNNLDKFIKSKSDFSFKEYLKKNDDN